VAEDFLDILTAGLQELGIEPDKDILNKYALYHRELRTWSKAYNITGLKDDRAMAIRLFLDSLLYLQVFPEPSQGSGLGIPGYLMWAAGAGFQGLYSRLHDLR